MLFVRISRLAKGAFTRGNHAFCNLQRKTMAEPATNEIAPGTPSLCSSLQLGAERKFVLRVVGKVAKTFTFPNAVGAVTDRETFSLHLITARKASTKILQWIFIHTEGSANVSDNNTSISRV